MRVSIVDHLQQTPRLLTAFNAHCESGTLKQTRSSSVGRCQYIDQIKLHTPPRTSKIFKRTSMGIALTFHDSRYRLFPRCWL